MINSQFQQSRRKLKKHHLIIVDDHKLITDGLRTYFTGHAEILIVGEAANGQEALDLLERKKVDLALTDVSMPIMDGIEFCKSAIKANPDLKVIALSMHNEYQHIKTMLNAGAVAYLIKNCGKKELLKAVETVLRGETYQNDEVTAVVMKHMMKKSNTSSSSAGFFGPIQLTQREKEILKLVVDEFSNNEIADKLNISVRTVNAHKGNLIEKTGAKNVVGLIMYALRNGIVE
jgi:DNA-binding NarL/FixJ family response regulator